MRVRQELVKLQQEMGSSHAAASQLRLSQAQEQLQAAPARPAQRTRRSR
jgi:hypothetical protein